MTPASLALRYAAFAAIAIVINLATQAVALRIYSGPFALTIAIFLGIATALPVKYLLDKRWIFFDGASGLAAHGRRFVLYTTTGVFTTAIFWGLENAFDALTPDGRYRFVGAAIGLVIGYVTKFCLDRRYVFRGGIPGKGRTAQPSYQPSGLTPDDDGSHLLSSRSVSERTRL